MSSTASIIMSGSVSQVNSNGQLQNQPIMYQVGGSPNQIVQRGQPFQVPGYQNGQPNYNSGMEGPRPNYQPYAQQQSYQQFQMQPQTQQNFNPQLQYSPQPQFQSQQQYQMQQQLPPQQYQQIQQPQYQQQQLQYQQQQLQYQQQQQLQYQQQQQYYQQQKPVQYEPQQQFQQHSPAAQQPDHQPIEMAYSQGQMSAPTVDSSKPPIFEAPVGRIQVVKKNQSPPTKSSAEVIQQCFKSSRSGSFVGLDEITDPPQFIKHPEPQQAVTEGDPVCISARVIPAGDSNLTVQWYKDSQPLAAGSRFNTSFERGFAVLEILYTFKEDSGEYSCVAKNNFGMDQTSPSILFLSVDENDVANTTLPQEMANNIAVMEANLSSQRIEDTYSEKPKQPPQFLRAMPGLYNLMEGQSLHLETLFIPINDSALLVEWYKNGKPLNNGSRFNMISDRGFAILDIIGLIPDDDGDYFCFARNSVGQAQSNVVRLSVTAEASVVTTSQLPQESIQHLQTLDSYMLDDIERPDFRYEETEESECPPSFDIKPVEITVEEGNPAKFLVKVSGYPRPRIQWILNDSLCVSTSTQKVYNDGSISYLEFNKCKNLGESNVVVIAKNKLGEASVSTKLTVTPINDFRPELKRVDPAVTSYNENPFRKLSSLKKVDVSPELRKAFIKQKPMIIELNNVEKESGVRGRQSRSDESATAGNLYNNIQANLRRSDRLNYCGVPNSNITPTATQIKEQIPSETTNSSSATQSQTTIQTSQMTFSFGKANSVGDHNPSEFTQQLAD